MSRELKKYRLRYSPRPLGYVELQSTVVITTNSAECYYCYVAFSDDLVMAVGKKLPQGVSAKNPACLYVHYDGVRYHVYAKYLSYPGAKVPLWIHEGGQPTWLRFHKVKEDANSKT